jgi:hypothetical protein
VGSRLARQGAKDGIQKARRASREERPMILTSKRQTISDIDDKQGFVCNINIM